MNISQRGAPVIKLFHFPLAWKADCGHHRSSYRSLFSVFRRVHTLTLNTRTHLCPHINSREWNPSVANNTVHMKEEAFKETRTAFPLREMFILRVFALVKISWQGLKQEKVCVSRVNSAGCEVFCSVFICVLCTLRQSFSGDTGIPWDALSSGHHPIHCREGGRDDTMSIICHSTAAALYPSEDIQTYECAFEDVQSGLLVNA